MHGFDVMDVLSIILKRSMTTLQEKWTCLAGNLAYICTKNYYIKRSFSPWYGCSLRIISIFLPCLIYLTACSLVYK